MTGSRHDGVVRTALQLQERGRQASNRGRYAEARSLLERALARTEEPGVRARCLVTLAHIAAERGRTTEGLELCRQALATPGICSLVRGLGLAQMALLHMRSGAAVAALDAFAAAQPLLQGEHQELARLHLNRGNIHLQRYDADAAVADFERAAALTDDPVERAKAEHNRGYAEYLRGNLVEALRLMEAADAVLDPLSPVLRAVNESDRAEVLSACGLPESAAAALGKAARAFSARRLRQSQAEAELAQARILLALDPGRAGQVARRAARRFRARGSEDWALRADAVAMGAQVRAGRPGRRLEEAARDLHEQLRRHRLRTDAQSVALYAASAALRRRDTRTAKAWAEAARVRAGDPMPSRLLDREVRAGLALAAGRAGPGYGHLRRGLDDLHEWLSAYGSLDLQSSLVGQGRALATQGLRLAVREGRPEAVFEWSERARVLISRVSPVRPPRDDSARTELAELRRRAERGQDVAELRDRIRRHAWYAPSLGPAARPADLRSVQARLGEDALVAWVLAGGDLHAVVLTSTSARLVHLGAGAEVLERLPSLAADLDMAAAELVEPLSSVIRASLADQLTRIGERLLGPLLPMLGDGRVVVVCAGGLAAVPWTLLPGLRGRPVTIARSATHWAAAGRPEAPARAGFVTGPDVPRAAEEARRAAAVWAPGSSRVALDADAARVSALAEEVDVLHVAAHGRHSAENPLFSGIELTGGPWFGYDIDALSAVPSVVVLSACELGRSSARGGAELVGMTTAWLHAGSRTVIASPAAVNDAAACDLLPRVHSGLVAGKAPAEALADACGQVPQVAPFACYGSGW